MLSAMRWSARLAGVLVVLLSCSTVHAGGLYFFDRGARPLSRGGAFIAGADDPGALWYNPAGLAESKNQVLSDAVLTIPFVSFKRYTGEGPDFNKEREVDAHFMPLPIPTLAFSHDFGTKDFVIGAGIFAPNALLINWPRSIPGPNGTNNPSPTRYSLIGINGSVLASLVGGLAYRGIKHLSLGADVQVTGGRFKAETVLSACDGALCSFPEDPNYDAYATLDAIPVYGVTGTFGLTYNLWDLVRWGASVTLPYTLRGPGSINLKIPNVTIFEDAVVNGNKANLSINLPLVVRVGSEIRPLPYLRMEGAVVWEQWSSQKVISIEPKDVSISNVTGIGTYEVGKLDLVRKMNDVWSLRGGFELFVPARWMIGKWKNLNLALRGGMAFEKSAFKNSTITPLTIDFDKLVTAGGLSFDLAKWLRFDTVAGWAHMWDHEVTNSSIRQPTAIRPATGNASALGNGMYKAEAIFLGGGFVLKMD